MEAPQVMLVLGTSQTFHREIIAGVGAYVRERSLNWILSLERGIAPGAVMPALIVDADAHAEALASVAAGRMLVCVGSAASTPCPADVPLVCSDNAALIALALRHLHDVGVRQLAFCGKSKYAGRVWARERLAAFVQQAGSAAAPAVVHAGNAESEEDEQRMLHDWVANLPPRTGIVAVNDSTARDLLHICNSLGREVPDDLTIVGIDNDPLVDALTPTPISSVIQGAREIGRKAAELLHRSMRQQALSERCVAVQPSGLQLAKTSRHTRIADMLNKAIAYIAAHVGEGIKAEQVAQHVGMSRSALERSFEARLGRTIHDEILQTRLALAKQLLSNRHLSVAEVAERCGFRTQQYMHVVFKRELGCTPGEFLKGQVGETI